MYMHTQRETTFGLTRTRSWKSKNKYNYQKAHHPEKHWHRFSNEVACKINFSTCMDTVRTTSGLKSLPGVVISRPVTRKRKTTPLSSICPRTCKFVLNPVIYRKRAFVSRFWGL